MIYNSKRNYTVEIDDYVTDKFITFTAKADISVNEAEAAVKVDISDITRNVVLNNNITVNDTNGYEANGVLFQSGGNPQTPSIYSGMAAKTTTVTMKNSSVDSFANGWYSFENLSVGGSVMLHNFNISAIATAKGLEANAIGISGLAITSLADFRGNFTISSQADSYAFAFGISAQNISAGDFSGKFKISAKSANEMVQGAGIFAAETLSLEKLSGSMDINIAGDQSSGCAVAGSTVSIARGFTGSLSVKNNSATGNIYGFQADSYLVFGGKTTGSITVNNQLKNAGSAYGIQADMIGLTNYSGNINVKATAQKDSDGMVGSYGITGTSFLAFFGGFTGNLTVSADNKSTDALSEVQAYGINSNIAVFDGVSGNWNITANGCTATAYGIKAENYMVLGDFTGNKSVAAKGNIAESTLLYAGNDDIYAGNVSGKLQVTSTGTACGFNSWGDLNVLDMSKMDLQVSGLNAKAFDIGDNVVLRKSGLDLGKITVKGDEEAAGIACGNIAVTVVDINNTSVVLNDRLEGTVSVTSKNGDAYGIQVAEGIEAVLSSNITATGKTSAHAVQFKDGNLTIDNAKITAKVTDKGKAANAYAIQVIDDGNYGQSNNITITGNSVLTGLVSLGKGTDKVTIESGSKVIGGFQSVDNGVILKINDATQKNNVMWQATEATSQTYVSVQVEYGLLGDFKIISKDKNIEWTELFSQIQYDNMYSNLIKGNELYTYGLVKKGNDLYVSAMFKNALGDNAEKFETQSTAKTQTNKEYTAFTDKADIKVTDEEIALDASKSKLLVLDNNITINSTEADIYGVKLAIDNAGLISNNAAKTLNVANSSSPDVENATVAGYTSSNKIKIQGGKFLQNITVSGKNEEADRLSVAGIIADTVISSDTVIAGNFNITGKAADKLDTWGIKAENSETQIKDISGKFNVSADTDGNTVTAIGVQAYAMTMDKFSGKMTIKSSGNADYGKNSFAAGLYTTQGNLEITDGFSGSITVNAKDKYQVIAYGMAGGKEWTSDADLTLGGKNTGAITVTADGVQAATASGIYGANFITLSNYSGAITAKATANGNNTTSAAAIDQEKGMTCVGAFSSKLNVTALNKNKGKGTTYAEGISAKSDITMDDITGNWNITATGYDAGAYGLYTANGGNISVHDITGNITIKATAYNKNSEVSSYAFHAIDSFSANRISGKITVSATAGARGFYAYDRFAVTDMSKMNLSVSGSYAYGIEVKESLEVAATGLNLGKITVNAKGNAWGVNVSDYIYYDSYASVLNNRLEGNITVKSQNESAYGIDADAFAQYENSAVVKNTEVICSATVSVTGKSYAYGVCFYDGDLTLDNATITAKVTDKTRSEYAYAVYAVTGDHNIYITGKSKITGNICSYDGTDKVSIESGSKFVGGITGFEVVELIVDDAATAKQALWDVTDDLGDAVDLNINFDYGMTGDFLLATKESGFDWDDVIDLNDCTLYLGENNSRQLYGGCEYGDFNFELIDKGNQLILSVAENP